MGINQMGLIGPRAEQKKEEKPKKDWVERVLEGLQIAKGVSDVYSGYQEGAKTSEEREAAKFAQEGGTTAGDLIKLKAQGVDEVPAGTPGATPTRVKGADGQVRETFLGRAIKPEPTPLQKMTLMGEDGKPFTTFVKAQEGAKYNEYVKPDAPKEAKPVQTRLITRTDPETGEEIQEIVEDKPGQTFSGKPEDKSGKEVEYRYNALISNANKLKATVAEHGTNVMTGPEGDDMNRMVYEMAIDYAKLVDPDSVAREGEVAAAQKYMLPFRNWGGMTTTNETAQSQIDNYIKSLDQRLEARAAAGAGGPKPTLAPSKPGSGTAIAAPAADFKPRRQRSPKDGKWYTETAPDQWVLDANQKD